MNERLKLSEAAPQAIKAMLGLEGYVTKTSVSPLHKELIRIRASQINGCAFCLDMHVKEALLIGESEQRIFMLPVWKESTLFTSEEKIILALTEEITLIHEGRVLDSTYQKARKVFTEQYLAELIMTIVTINAWNRVAITTLL